MTLTIKQQQNVRFYFLLSSLTFSLCAVFLCSTQLAAATLYWDANGASAGTGGSGNWNTTDVVWRDGGTTGTLQAWVDNNDINLPTTAGTITLTDNITIGSNSTSLIMSAATGYQINGGGNTLTIDATGGGGAYRVGWQGGSYSINAPVLLKGYNMDTRTHVTFNGTVADGDATSRTLIINSGGSLTFNSANPGFSWGLNVTNGTLRLGNDQGAGTGNIAWGNAAGSLEAVGGDRVIANTMSSGWNGTFKLIGSNSLRFTTHQNFTTGAFSSKSTFNVVEADAVLTFDSAAGNPSYPAGFYKVGGGTIAFGSYSPSNDGIIDVQAGTLLANGPFVAEAINVDSGATLGGTGTINLGASSVIDIALGGTLAPGASVGTLTVNGDVNLDGTLALEFSGSTSDVLVVNGNLTLGSSSVLQYLNQLDKVSDYVIASYSGTLTGTFGSIDGIGPYVVDYGSGLNSQITLQVVPIPEPSSFFLLGCGALAFAFRKRTRR